MQRLSEQKQVSPQSGRLPDLSLGLCEESVTLNWIMGHANGDTAAAAVK